jgi:hypothetical protein
MPFSFLKYREVRRATGCFQASAAKKNRFNGFAALGNNPFEAAWSKR